MKERINVYCIQYNSHLYDGTKTTVELIFVANSKWVAKALFINRDRLGKLRYPNDGIISIVRKE